MTRPFALPALLLGAALAGPRSSLIGASFIDGAEIVTGAPDLAGYAGALRQVATTVGGTCQKSEYVAWNSAPGLEAQFQRSLATLGYTYAALNASEDGGHFVAFQAKKAGSTLVGLWADSDGTTLLGWCALKAAAAPSTAGPAAWPAFGTFRVGDTVQFYLSTGWKTGVVKEVGPQPGRAQGAGKWAAEKQYLIVRRDINDEGWQEWGTVAHVSRAPYWTNFFIGDWTVGEMMAVNTSVQGTAETTEFSYLGAGEALRVRSDGTYEWKDGARVTRGRWTPAPDGPGIVVTDARGHTWTLRNQTNLTTEKIRRLESARLFPSDARDMGKAATRPLRP